jgi:hypothetical protein
MPFPGLDAFIIAESTPAWLNGGAGVLGLRQRFWNPSWNAIASPLSRMMLSVDCPQISLATGASAHLRSPNESQADWLAGSQLGSRGGEDTGNNRPGHRTEEDPDQNVLGFVPDAVPVAFGVHR